MIPAIKELIGRHSNDRDENGELIKREKLADDLIKLINTRYPKETPPAHETIQGLFQSPGIIKAAFWINLGAWQVLPNIQYLMMLFPM